MISYEHTTTQAKIPDLALTLRSLHFVFTARSQECAMRAHRQERTVEEQLKRAGLIDNSGANRP